MKRIFAVLRAEWRSISRDLLLTITIFVPLIVAVFVRIVTPLAAELLILHTGFDLTGHYQFIAGVAILMTPMMLGAMAGLQILDDRDQRILAYIAVTPLGREGYLIWKLFTPVIIGCILTPVALAIMNILPLRLGVVIPVTLLASLQAPVYALLLPAFAGNKVEGLAVAKASGLIMWAPFAGYLLPMPWPIIAATMPTFWPSMAFIAGYRGESFFWAYIVSGLAVNLAWLAVMRRLFRKRTG